MLTPATSHHSKSKLPPPGAVLMDYEYFLPVIGFPYPRV
jgi:hypothetical protein